VSECGFGRRRFCWPCRR